MRNWVISGGLGILVGVVIGEWWTIPSWQIGVYFVIAIICLGLFWTRYHSYIALFIWGSLFVVLGNWRLAAVLPIPQNDINSYDGQTVTFVGKIVDDPQVTLDAGKFTVIVQSFNDEIGVEGKVLIKTGRYPGYNYGNILNITCKISSTSSVDVSSYTKYLGRFNIYATCDYPQIDIKQEFAGNLLWRWLYQLKHYFLHITNQTMPEPTASLLAGLLLGVSATLPKQILDGFNTAGLTHIIALSGFNISIVAGAVLGLLRWLPLSLRLAVAIIAIWLFVLLTGAAPSAVRAGLMGMIILSAGLFGRLSDISVSLVLSAALMVVANPKILLGDIGFQLSFLATIGIIYFSPFLVSLNKTKFTVINNLVVPTLAALVMVTPILMISFGRVSIIAPLTNVLVVPLVPIAMLLGFWAVVGGMISPILGSVLGWVAWLPLRLVVAVAEYMKNLPWASVNLEVQFGWWLILYYLIIIGVLIWYYVAYNHRQLRSHH
ncbi:ComEC family competence protein [Patescibacteria group bacterium]|nr:ComEC family competence protein [Patescibacteria group bacterium]